VRVAWGCAAGGERFASGRDLELPVVRPVEADLPHDPRTPLAAGQPVPLVLRNHGAAPASCTVRWRGDFGGGSRREELPPGRAVRAGIPVEAAPGDVGLVRVWVHAGADLLLDRRVRVAVAPEGWGGADGPGR
jgi:hypothetical protein